MNKSLQKQKSIFLFFRNSNGVLSPETVVVFAHKVICQIAVLPKISNDSVETLITTISIFWLERDNDAKDDKD